MISPRSGFDTLICAALALTVTRSVCAPTLRVKLTVDVSSTLSVCRFYKSRLGDRDVVDGRYKVGDCVGTYAGGFRLLTTLVAILRTET